MFADCGYTITTGFPDSEHTLYLCQRTAGHRGPHISGDEDLGITWYLKEGWMEREMARFENKAANIPPERLQKAFSGEAAGQLGHEVPFGDDEIAPDAIIDAEVVEDDGPQPLEDICEEAFLKILQDHPSIDLERATEDLVKAILAWEKSSDRKVWNGD